MAALYRSAEFALRAKGRSARSPRSGRETAHSPHSVTFSPATAPGPPSTRFSTASARSKPAWARPPTGAEIVKLCKEHAELRPVAEAVEALARPRAERADLEEMAGSGDPEMAAMAADEICGA